MQQFIAIPDFPKYEISRTGKIRSRASKYKKPKYLSPRTHLNGYQVVRLANGAGKYPSMYLQRLVLSAWVREPQEGEVADHRDHNRSNNNLSNLRWVTKSQNRADAPCTAGGIRRPVVQILDGAVKKTFESVTAAAAEIGQTSASITNCLRGRQKTAGGCSWRYANEN